MAARSSKSFAAVLRVAVTETGESGESRLREIADALVMKAVNGDLASIKEIADRLDSKSASAADEANDPAFTITRIELVAPDALPREGDNVCRLSTRRARRQSVVIADDGDESETNRRQG